MTPREQTAYHEAGHAVIGLLRGLEVTRVALDPSGRSGRATYTDLTPDQWKLGEAEAIAALAGVCAEGQASGSMTRSAYADDLEHARAGIRLFRQGAGLPTDGATIEAELRRYAHVSNDAVTDAWGGITSVAQELLLKGKLNGNDVRALLGQHGLQTP